MEFPIRMGIWSFHTPEVLEIDMLCWHVLSLWGGGGLLVE